MQCLDREGRQAQDGLAGGGLEGADEQQLAAVYLDPQVLRHDAVAFAAGTRTESVKLPTRELFEREDATTVPLIKRPERASDDPVGRRRAAQQTLAGRGPPSS